MTKKNIYIVQVFILALLLPPGEVSSAGASGTLYEKYVNGDEETLRKETKEMSNRVATAFSQGSVSSHQQRIDFAEYFSNLKKMVRFGSKLAGYSDYERDLEFARDKEIFKGLPDSDSHLKEKRRQFDRKEFVHVKYKMMTKNVQDEIDTYVDLMEIALDGCEILASNDLSGILGNEKYRERIEMFTKTEVFARYESGSARLSNRWPDLEARIAAQFSLWQIKSPSPDEPLIELTITGAL